MEDDEEVVQEFNIFHSKTLEENLYVLQYPINHCKKKYSSDQRYEARIKPHHNKIEIDAVLDVNSPNYDQSKGEQIALNVDGNNTEDEITYKSSIMDTQVLSSSVLSQNGKRYAAAFFDGKQIHLTSVSQVLQMRPSFRYMDKAEKRAIQAAKMKAQAESGNSSQDEVEEAKAVTVRFKGAETEAARAARESSYASYEKKLLSEKWISASVHHKGDSIYQREKNRLASTKLDFGDMTEMLHAPTKYLDSIVPKYIEADAEVNVGAENVLSLANLREIPLPDQLKALMKNAKIIHFSHLLSLLPDSPDKNVVARSLQSYAVLVQGCWIVKSDVLYPPKTLSCISGISSESMCRSRDYILCLFTQHQFLVRREVAKKLKIPGDEIKAIFNDIALMKPGKGWHLRLLPDARFVKQFPDITERQVMVWGNRFKQIAKLLHIDVEDYVELPVDISNVSEVSSPKQAQKKISSPKAAPKRKQQSEKSKAIKASVTIKSEILSPTRVHNQTFNNNIEMQDQSNVIKPMQAIDRSVKSEPEPMKNEHNSNPMPFVQPKSVGINLPSCSSVNSEAPDFSHITSINMDIINSTVVSVADQVRQQNGVLSENTKASSNGNEILPFIKSEPQS